MPVHTEILYIRSNAETNGDDIMTSDSGASLGETFKIQSWIPGQGQVYFIPKGTRFILVMSKATPTQLTQGYFTFYVVSSGGHSKIAKHTIQATDCDSLANQKKEIGSQLVTSQDITIIGARGQEFWLTYNGGEALDYDEATNYFTIPCTVVTGVPAHEQDRFIGALTHI